MALIIGLAGTAPAVTFGSIPTAPAPVINDGLDDIYGAGTTSRNGLYDATLYLIGGPADIEVSYLGSEAGFENESWWGGALFAKTTGLAGTCVWDKDGLLNELGSLKQTFTNVASGALEFFFCSPFGDAINDGTNPDPKTGGLGPNYFVTFENENAAGGQVAYPWFDDDGAGSDDNHDDMAIRIAISSGSLSAIPLPAAGWLLLAGLGGLGALRRFRKS